MFGYNPTKGDRLFPASKDQEIKVLFIFCMDSVILLGHTGPHARTFLYSNPKFLLLSVRFARIPSLNNLASPNSLN